jgi:hypothetical protein
MRAGQPEILPQKIGKMPPWLDAAREGLTVDGARDTFGCRHA